MEYWKNNITMLEEDEDIKRTSECIPPKDGATRACFDDVGVPVMPNAVFGRLRCNSTSDSKCATCPVIASGFQVSFLLNNNAYSDELAMTWEKEVLIKNIKTFNLLSGYKTELDPGESYNDTLKQIL